MASQLVLLIRSCGRLCALPASGVEETLRPLPTHPIAQAPEFVLGLTLLRGHPAPVVDLARLLAGAEEPCGRYVSLRLEGRRAVLAVNHVVGVHELDSRRLQQVPPLLRDTQPELVQAVAEHDHQLLVLLSGARLFSQHLWQQLEEAGVH